MNIHIGYSTWTYSDVRARVIEAADTLMMGEPDRGPGFAGLMGDVVQAYNDAYGAAAATFKRIPSPGALARMEETWTWINTWLGEDDRRICYEYGFVMTRRGHTIAGWCERNGWIKRTFERAVNRACNTIAEHLNRKYAVRLHSDVDVLSQITAKSASFEVASDNRAPVKRKDYHRADDATPIHIPGTEAETAKHIEKVNKQRRDEAERQRKIALRKREEAARLAAQVEARLERRRQQAAKQRAA
ncbi:MAG: hypothetical protein EOS65_02585 [Mesorhizobium sp.]|uniref:DUF6362 family protein n=1 Tax=Mesorhizobium sp. TaxID=1871066 RepID=UPI000FE7AB92|nr:DUF6362 family protein [Mesorhizobium sp.]RWF44282.1 MAG: hypothetical protein EOS65_02585 [Mesorhizobium sp.]